jgi:hypothetical protein
MGKKRGDDRTPDQYSGAKTGGTPKRRAQQQPRGEPDESDTQEDQPSEDDNRSYRDIHSILPRTAKRRVYEAPSTLAPSALVIRTPATRNMSRASNGRRMAAPTIATATDGTGPKNVRTASRNRA